jgi:hypothetical protein
MPAFSYKIRIGIRFGLADLPALYKHPVAILSTNSSPTRWNAASLLLAPDSPPIPPDAIGNKCQAVWDPTMLMTCGVTGFWNRQTGLRERCDSARSMQHATIPDSAPAPSCGAEAW